MARGGMVFPASEQESQCREDRSHSYGTEPAEMMMEMADLASDIHVAVPYSDLNMVAQKLASHRHALGNLDRWRDLVQCAAVLSMRLELDRGVSILVALKAVKGSEVPDSVAVLEKVVVVVLDLWLYNPCTVVVTLPVVELACGLHHDA